MATHKKDSSVLTDNEIKLALYSARLVLQRWPTVEADTCKLVTEMVTEDLSDDDREELYNRVVVGRRKHLGGEATFKMSQAVLPELEALAKERGLV